MPSGSDGDGSRPPHRAVLPQPLHAVESLHHRLDGVGSRPQGHDHAGHAALICPIKIANTTEVLVTLGFGVVTTVSTHASKGVLGRDRGMLLLAQYAGFVAILWMLARMTH